MPEKSMAPSVSQKSGKVKRRRTLNTGLLGKNMTKNIWQLNNIVITMLNQKNKKGNSFIETEIKKTDFRNLQKANIGFYRPMGKNYGWITPSNNENDVFVSKAEMPMETEYNVFCFETGKGEKGKYAFNLKPVSIETILDLFWEDLLPKAAAAEKAAEEKESRDSKIKNKFNLNKFIQTINLENFQINCDLECGEHYWIISGKEESLIGIYLNDIDYFEGIEIYVYDKMIRDINHDEIVSDETLKNLIKEVVKNYQKRGGDYSSWGDCTSAESPLSLEEQEALIESFLD